MVYLAVIVFLVAALTDYFDGWVARRYGATSDLGTLLDPIADKILVMAGLVMLAAQPPDAAGPWVPGWLVVLVLGREMWVTGLRAAAASRRSIVPAGLAGKIKVVLQVAAVSLLLLHGLPLARVTGVRLLMLSTLFSYWGAVQYTRRVLSEPSPAPEPR